MKTRTIPYRRKREGKTNYKKRLRLLLSKKHRLVIRKSLKNIIAQIVEFKPEGDRVVVSASSQQLKKLGWKLHGGNIVTGYLVGFMMGKRAKVKEAVLDMGLQTSGKGCCLYAVLKGVIDAGMNIPHSKEILPGEERVKGKHISDYAKKLKENKAVYERQFSKLLKEGVDPEKVDAYIEEIKKKIGGGK